MDDLAPEHRTLISEREIYPLEVGLMSFRHMPEKRVVSLLIPERANYAQTRIMNMNPQTALNLLAWLRAEEATLIQLAERERR